MEVRFGLMWDRLKEKHYTPYVIKSGTGVYSKFFISSILNYAFS